MADDNMRYNSHSESDTELPQLPNEMLDVSFLCFTNNEPFVSRLLVLPWQRRHGSAPPPSGERLISP